MYAMRRREERDIPALFDLFRQPSCRQAMSGPDFASQEELSDWLKAAGPGGIEFVATAGDVAVGFAALFGCRGERGHTGWIALFIHDAHQGRGLGEQLLRTLVEIADRRLALRRLELVVRCDNAAAIEFYRRRGFRVEGRHVEFAYRDGEYLDVYTMSRLNPRRAAAERLAKAG